MKVFRLYLEEVKGLAWGSHDVLTSSCVPFVSTALKPCGTTCASLSLVVERKTVVYEASIISQSAHTVAYYDVVINPL